MFPLWCGKLGEIGKIPSKLILHESFNKTIAALKSSRIRLPQDPEPFKFDLTTIEKYESIGRVEPIGKMGAIKLDGKIGCDICQERLTGKDRAAIAAYDESIAKFYALEGAAYFTSHCVVFLEKSLYAPINQLTMYFYTKSQEIHERSPFIRLSDNIATDSELDYYNDRIQLLKSALLDNELDNSILLIDGPLIAGDAYTSYIEEYQKFTDRGILPIFFVKNSDSSLVINNDETMKKKYNSDLHWSNNILKPGTATNFFKYIDPYNERNTKTFCYLKAFDCTSPVRIEIPTSAYVKNERSLSSVLNLIYYLILVQGDRRNPQARPIAVAEKYARSTLKLVNFEKLMRSSGLQPTMNENRGFTR